MTVLQSLRDGLLCGFTPTAVRLGGRASPTSHWQGWRGDRHTLLAIARRFADSPPGTPAVVEAHGYDYPPVGPRRRRQYTFDIAPCLCALLGEEHRREQARARRAPRVHWRPRPSQR